MNALSPKLLFQTLRKFQLSKDDLQKNIQEFEVDGVIVVINGELKILDLNYEAVKTEKDLQKRIINAVNTATSAMQEQNFQALQGITV